MSPLLRGFREGWAAARLSQAGVIGFAVAGSVLAVVGLIAARLA